jgi:hypothetical protein
MSVVSITIFDSHGNQVGSLPNIDPTTFTDGGTPPTYNVPVDSLNLPASETYTVTVSPNVYHKVGQIPPAGSNGTLGYLPMEDGGG